MAVAWTITNPSGSGTSSLAALGISSPQIVFRIMGPSTASLTVLRDLDSEDDWWAADSLVTIYRDGSPYFTGRVQESPDSASGSSETRVLELADAWDDLETTVYQEAWSIGSGSAYFPRCILGMNSAGTAITSGAQIGEVIDYAISRGVSMTKGTIDAGLQLWPSEVQNTSCESVIVEELRFHPDWSARLDHSTAPPTFTARAKSALSTVTIDIADETVESHTFAKVVRNVPLGVRIIYNSASSIDGEVYRNGYLDEAGVTTGRRVMQATLDLKGLTMQFQKSRIQTRTLPTSNAEMTAYFKKKWPELKDMPDGAFEFTNFASALATEETHPDPVNPKAVRLSVSTASDLPRELVSGSVEDWMRVKVGRVAITYDLKIIGSPSAAQKKILDNFSGEGKSFSVTATNATTKIYKGISSFDEGEGKPSGIAAAVFAAATEDQYQGSVTLVQEDVPAGTFHGTKLILANGEATLMPGAIVHSCAVDIDYGTMTLTFGPLPYLSAGDFLELQRMFQRRKVCWMSPAERSSNQLGAETEPGSKGDTVGGYDYPGTTVPPGGGTAAGHVWKVTSNGDEFVTVSPGEVLSLAHDDVTDEGGVLSSYFQLKKFFSYAGSSTIEVEGAGVIYGSVPVIRGASSAGGINLDPGSSPGTLFWLTSIIPDTTGSLTVAWAATLPAPTSGNDFVFEIAQVSLDASVSVVDKQVLTHNPTALAWAIEGGASSP